MAFEIPIQSAPAFSERVRLEGVFYTLSFRWNARLGAWVFDLSDGDGNGLVLGSPVRAGAPLAFFPSLAGVPPGMFLALDTSGAGVDPAIDELGKRVKVFYLEAAEIAGG